MSNPTDNVSEQSLEPMRYEHPVGSQEKLQNLRTQLYSLTDDINDFIDENDISDMEHSIDDVDTAIRRMENFRSMFREKHQEIHLIVGKEDYDKEFNQIPENMISNIKEYILNAKQIRKGIRNQASTEKLEADAAKIKYSNFLYDETGQQILDLAGEVVRSPKDFSDVELASKRDHSVEIQKRLDLIWSKVSEMIKMNINALAVDDIKLRYKRLAASKNQYIILLQEEVANREIEKKENFKRSKLNINLAKFCGYNSASDIYTFQSEFEKIHLDITPKGLLPDLLKHNFLADPALSLVKSVSEIDEIWKRLKQAYGDSKALLQKKLRDLNNLESGHRTKDNDKMGLWISKIITIMKDLSKLANDHRIEGMLYNGDGINRILKLIGEGRVTRWLSKDDDTNEDDDFEKRNKDSWNSLIAFLEKDLKVLQRKALVFQSIPEKESGGKKQEREHKKESYHSEIGSRFNESKNCCSICGKTDHVMTTGPGYSQVVQYFACQEFAKMSPAERFKELWQKRLCFQCLFPGANWNTGKHKEGKCQRDFVCRHESHDKFARKKHVLVCDEHKGNPENEELLKKYKERCILKGQNIPTFSKEIKLSFHSQSDDQVYKSSSSDIKAVNKAIYQLQVIEVNKEKYLIFYDTGCSDFVVRYDAIQRLGNKAVLEHPPPLKIGGVGGVTTESQYGAYTVNLPLHDSSEARFTGVCLEQITETFPQYPIHGAVDQDIRTAYKIAGGRIEDLPTLPKSVGGDVDFMIGIKYLRYHPEFVFQLPSGLTIYRSRFTNANGGRGIIGGPHEVFTAMEKQFHLQKGLSTFICDQDRLYSFGYSVNPDIGLLGYKAFRSPGSQECGTYNSKPSESFTQKAMKLFNSVEDSGSEISYRCIKCRSCKNCRNCDEIESMSLKEEVEEDLIKNSVVIDVENRKCTAKLPFIQNPGVCLVPNKHRAMKVYYQQLKKLKRSDKDREEIIIAEAKLQKLGYVDYVKNLSQEAQDMLKFHHVQNFIPWRIVWKDTSVSSPCRPVFDASQPTDSGKSLNDTLAKGRNNMNKLQEILIRWSMHKVGYHTDVQKMYNSVALREEDWCFQRYLWQEDLNAEELPEEKVIKTIIYGVKSSGNLSERALRETAALSKDEFPEVFEIVNKDVYVDDCISGESNVEDAHQRADQFEIVLNKGGFTLKGFTFSGYPPSQDLSDDNESIFVGGMKWYPENDELSFNIGDLNFARKCRGRKPTAAANIIPERLTRRQCVSKVAEIFDICGKLTPITSSMKMDLHDLVIRKLDWDDVIPDNLRQVWKNHFEMMTEIKNIKYKRAVVPDDAVNLDINTLDLGDASSTMACVAIYARFARKNGKFSCQLVLGRSRMVPENMSQPRAELFAAVLNTHSGEIVRKAFYKMHKEQMKMSDSQIALHWIKSEDRPLKQWVRNRVIEIRRLTKLEDWRYVDSKNMLADIGTRRGCTLDDIKPGSAWINGYEWMTGDSSSFPVKKIDEMNLTNDELLAARNEIPFIDPGNQASCSLIRYASDKTVERYQYSNYVVDPNLRKFSSVVRITAIVLKFIHKLKSQVKDDASIMQVPINDEDVQKAENYFFRKATDEIKHFQKNRFKNLVEKEGILYYTGRMLPSELNIVTPMSEAMKDLTPISFCVPAVDKHSPIACAIVSDIHWNDAAVKHAGIESMWRYVLKKVYIIEGREVVKNVKKSCERCRYIEKKTIEVAMGPLSTHNVTIAPSFYVTQIDLAGPFKAYCQHNRRSTIKVWLVVFCCTTTSSIKIKVMEDYSTTSFIQAFIRFSSDVGYPKVILIDEGSQLVKGCQTMKLDFVDAKLKLHKDVGVAFQTCPVGGHNVNGRVERKIREVKGSIERNMSNERLSIIQWETLSAKIANSINDLPLALGNNVSDFESMDLITPNRLLLGRNNDRSPTGNMLTTNHPDKIIEGNNKIFQCWFENWIISCVPKLIVQPKWYKTEYHIKVGDIVLFAKDECNSPTYQYGIVQATQPGNDGLVRKAVIKYRNSHEDFDRETNRAVRTLTIIHKVEEINIMQDMYEMSCKANKMYSQNVCLNN